VAYLDGITIALHIHLYVCNISELLLFKIYIKIAICVRLMCNINCYIITLNLTTINCFKLQRNNHHFLTRYLCYYIF